MRDPQFRDKALIEFLDKAQVAPDRIVIEITEHLVIENYEMFRDTMALLHRPRDVVRGRRRGRGLLGAGVDRQAQARAT